MPSPLASRTPTASPLPRGERARVPSPLVGEGSHAQLGSRGGEGSRKGSARTARPRPIASQSSRAKSSAVGRGRPLLRELREVEGHLIPPSRERRLSVRAPHAFGVLHGAVRLDSDELKYRSAARASEDAPFQEDDRFVRRPLCRMRSPGARARASDVSFVQADSVPRASTRTNVNERMVSDPAVAE